MSRAGTAVAKAANPYLQLTDAQLADVMGDLDEAEAALKARIKRAREVAEVRGLSELKGRAWIIVRVIGGIDRLDTKALKKSFGLEWYATWTKPGTRTTWTATRIADMPQAPAPIAPPVPRVPCCAG